LVSPWLTRGRLKEKYSQFEYLCYRIEDITLCGSQPKSEKPTLPGSAQYGSTSKQPDSQNVDDSSTSSSLPPFNAQFPTPTSSSQPESRLSSPEIISDNDYIPATQSLQAEEAPP